MNCHDMSSTNSEKQDTCLTLVSLSLSDVKLSGFSTSWRGNKVIYKSIHMAVLETQDDYLFDVFDTIHGGIYCRMPGRRGLH